MLQGDTATFHFSNSFATLFFLSTCLLDYFWSASDCCCPLGRLHRLVVGNVKKVDAYQQIRAGGGCSGVSFKGTRRACAPKAMFCHSYHRRRQRQRRRRQRLSKTGCFLVVVVGIGMAEEPGKNCFLHFCAAKFLSIPSWLMVQAKRK